MLSPLAVLVLAVLAGRIADGRWADFGPALHAPYGPPWIATTLILALAYGFGEEPGWRGFLLPHLGQRFGQVTTILLLTLAWGVWHGLMFVYRLPNAPVMMVGFFIGLLAGSIWLAWLYERTHSILVVALWHAVWNIVNIPALLVSEYGCGRAQHPGDGAGDYHQHRLVLAAPQARSKQPRGPVEVAHTRLGHAGCAAVRGDSPGRFLPRGPVIWRLKAPD